MLNDNFKITKNSHGLMHKMNSISRSFVDYAKNCNGTVLDIGAAYGVATIATLVNSLNTHVIACDIAKNHLDDLLFCAKQTADLNNIKIDSRLTLRNDKFPNFDLEENSLNAALASHVIPFLTGKEVELGVIKLAKFLKPGGKFYMASYSIYNNLMKNYIPIYESRKLKGDAWPGEIEDASLYWEKTNPLSKMLPKQLNHLDLPTIKALFLQNNFRIDYLEYLPTSDEIPEEIKLDGREVIGLIVTNIKNS